MAELRSRLSAAAETDSSWQRLLRRVNDRPGSEPSGHEMPEPPQDILTELYLPLCSPTADGPQIIGHLGQSLDGFIATASGDSSFVNDPENILHLHRLRALHDAVIVGAGTVAADDPQLTTRLVAGHNPVRVVLDPDRRLGTGFRVFSDGIVKTILVAAEPEEDLVAHGQAEVLFVRRKGQELDLGDLIRKLEDRGLRRLFVEGGGITVTRFFDAGLLDRLQLAIAPVLIGRGKPGLQLLPRDRMDHCPRPRHRLFAMGRDLLFDCDLRRDENPNGYGAPAPQDLSFTDDGVSRLRRIR